MSCSHYSHSLKSYKIQTPIEELKNYWNLGAINKEQVIKFYEANAFFPIEKDPDSESIKMIKPYFKLLDEEA